MLLVTTSITLNIGWIVFLVIYAMMATGLALAIFAAASRQADKQARTLAEMNKQLGAQMKGVESLGQCSKIDEAREKTRFMAKEYVKLQNEYAWYRNMVRNEFPEAYTLVQTRLQMSKKAAAELKKVINPEVMNG